MIYENFRRGINIGGWLSQYEFLAEQPLTEEHLRQHWDTFIMETDLKQIAKWGFDHVRLPVSGYFLYNREEGVLNPTALDYIKKCIQWCSNTKLNLVLDLHDLWGNVYGAMEVPMPLLTEEKLKLNFFTIWEELTKACKGIYDIKILFELLNEVSDATGYLWNRMYKEAIRRIRKIDEQRMILVGSNCQNSVAYLNQLDLVEDPLVFYNFHYYEPQVFTHQRAGFSEEMCEFNQVVTYPGDISDFVTYLEEHPQYQMKYALVAKETKNDSELMRQLLAAASDFVQYSGKELYCGEYGVINQAPPKEAEKWMDDLNEFFEQKKIGCALWNYKTLDFGLLHMDGTVVSEELLQHIQKKL